MGFLSREILRFAQNDPNTLRYMAGSIIWLGLCVGVLPLWGELEGGCYRTLSAALTNCSSFLIALLARKVRIIETIGKAMPTL